MPKRLRPRPDSAVLSLRRGRGCRWPIPNSGAPSDVVTTRIDHLGGNGQPRCIVGDDGLVPEGVADGAVPDGVTRSPFTRVLGAPNSPKTSDDNRPTFGDLVRRALVGRAVLRIP